MAKPTLFELGDDVRQKLSVFRSGKDANGIYTVVEYKRPDGTLYARSVMNGTYNIEALSCLYPKSRPSAPCGGLPSNKNTWPNPPERLMKHNRKTHRPIGS